jgi:hypothetical protein
MNYATSRMKKLARRQNIENRKAPRFEASAIPSLKRVSQVVGPEVRLINISRAGALIESQEPLSKGSSVCLRLVTVKSVYLLKGRILRYNISSMNGNVIQYQSAIVFDEDFTILPSNTEVEEIHEGAKVELTVFSRADGGASVPVIL